MLNAPFDLRAQGEGYKRLLDFGPISEGYAMAVVAARPDYIAANPEALRSYLAATREAIDWLYDPANRAEAIAILAKDTKQDAGISAATYDDLVVRQKPYDRNLDLPDSFLKKTLDGVIANGDASKGSTLAANVKDLSLRPR
jgi:ABC-type nitrate/sulfonate/bicarbonate transport system substrate-binding protein